MVHETDPVGGTGTFAGAAGSADSHPSFRTPALEAQFRRDGYVHLELLDPVTVADLRRRFAELYQGETEDVCDRSNESRDLEYRRAIHSLITSVLQPAVDELLVDHHTISTGTLVKWKGPNSSMPVHQDWTMVDEPRFRSLSLWVPLCDVTQDNGALAVLPGSHRVLSGMRPNPGRPPSLPDPLAGVLPEHLRSIHMSAGDCLVFDHGVLHGSPPNTVDQPRTAIVLAATPRAATLQHLWRRPEDDVIERFEVADPEFFRHCTPEVRPDHPAITLAETLPFRAHREDAAEWVASSVATARAGEGDADTASQVAPTAPVSTVEAPRRHRSWWGWRR